jgi:hypothetical protein
VNVVFDPVPTEPAAVRQTTAMSASISEYSTIVEPFSLLTNLRIRARNLAMPTSPFETQRARNESGAQCVPWPTASSGSTLLQQPCRLLQRTAWAKSQSCGMHHKP